LDFLLALVAIISFVLSFFLLIVSSTSNIKENKWEFGVIRFLYLGPLEFQKIKQ